MCFVFLKFWSSLSTWSSWGSSWWVCLFLSSTSAVMLLELEQLSFQIRYASPTESMWSSLKKTGPLYSLVRVAWQSGSTVTYMGIGIQVCRRLSPLKLTWQWNITMFIVGDTSSDGWFFHCHVFLNSHYISQRKGGMCFEFGLWTFLLYNWVQLEDDQLRMFRSSSHLCFLSGLLLSRFWSLFNWIINDFAHISQDTLLKTNMTLENPWKSPCSIGNTSSNGGLLSY